MGVIFGFLVFLFGEKEILVFSLGEKKRGYIWQSSNQMRGSSNGSQIVDRK
jgi:hypothetical protein